MSAPTTSVSAPVVAPAVEPTSSGARSGVILAVASATSIAANYVFLLAAGRFLGSEDYGSLAAILGLLAVVLLPAGALQMAVAREVSRMLAGGDAEGAAAFSRTTMRLGLVATAPLVAVALLLAAPLASVLNIDSVGVVALAELAFVTTLVFPVALGVLQGGERFHALAVLYVLPNAIRLVLLAAAAYAGYRLGGAVLATVVAATAVALVSAALALRSLPPPTSGRTVDLREFLRYLGPVAVGLVGIALLTHADLLVVKARFSAADAGDYAAASAFARVAFFVPATILSVLFPRTAARQARGEDTEDILGRSLLVTAAFSVGLAIFYAAAGEGLVATTFGLEFSEGGRLLTPYACAMGVFSLAQVLVGYHLSRGETRYAWIVAAGVAVQVPVLALVPSSLHGVVWANLGVGLALLAAHELAVGSSVRPLRAGLLHFMAAADLRFRQLAIEGGLVLLGATVFVCALFWPVVSGLRSTVIGPGSDASGGVWFLWQLQHETGYHLFGTTHHTLTGAPFGWDQDNGLNIQWLLPYYLGYLATTVVGPVAGWNLVLLSGYVLSGASMYLLVRYLGCARLVAAWAGMVYVVFPWHLARTPHASLVHLEFIPLMLLALVAATRRPSWSRFGLVALTTMACWLTSGYFGAMAIVMAGAFGLAAALLALGRRALLTLAASVGSALGATFLVSLLSVVSGVGRGSGLHRVASDLSVYGLRPLELVVPAAGNLVVGDRLRSFLSDHQHHSNMVETSNYVGLLTIALAAAWLAVAWRRRATLSPRLRIATAGLLGTFVAALLLAFPSPVSVFGHDVWMPSRLLWEVVPPFRVPTRWIVVVMAALVPLAALALQEAWARVARRRTAGWAPAALVAAAAVFSFLELAIAPADSRFSTTPVPTEYSALDRAPPGIVAEYPLINSGDHIFWQIAYRRPTFGQADFGTPADDARRVVLDPAVPGAAENLALLGVTAIVTHRDALSYTDGVPDVPDADWGPGYRLLARTRDGASTWQVVAKPAPALATLPTGFSEPGPPRDGVVRYPLSSASGVGYVELRSKTEQVVRLVFDAEPPPGQKRVLRVTDAAQERPLTVDGRTRISVLVEVPRGLSRLLLKTDPAATSDEDAITLSAVRTEPGSGAAELHAEPVSADPGF